jgi:hypothetical protein
VDRSASSAWLAEIAKAQSQPFHLFEFALDSGTLYMTDAPRDIVYNGQTYTALSHFLEFSGIEETSELKVSTCTVTLSGVDQTMISAVLNEDYLDRQLKIYKGFIKEDDGRSLAFDFVGEESATATAGPATLVVTRAGATSTRFNSSGDLETVAANTARIDYDPDTLECLGLLVEPARTNSIRNNTMAGAAAGSPTSPPTNWTLSQGASGIAVEVVGVGTENGISYIDVRWHGTPSATQFPAAHFESNTGIAALQSQAWTAAAYIRLVGGSLTNVSAAVISMWENNSGGAFLTSGSGTTFIPTTNPLRTQRREFTRTLANASTAFVRPQFAFTVTSGQAIDVTFRIGMPQMELGAFKTSVIPTTSAAVTRNLDLPAVSSVAGWYNHHQGSIFVEYDSLNTSFGNTFAFTDGTGTTDDIIGYVNTASSNRSAIRWRDGGVVQAEIAGLNGATLGHSVQHAAAWKANDFASSHDGGAIVTDSAGTIPTPDRLYLGAGPGGGAQLGGHVRQFVYWPRRLTDADLITLSGGGSLSETAHTVIDPIAIFDGRGDQPSISENPDDGKCTVTIDFASHWVDFERRPGRHTNHEEQQIHFSGDMFFEFVSGLDRQINWGVPSPGAAAQGPTASGQGTTPRFTRPPLEITGGERSEPFNAATVEQPKWMSAGDE